MTEIMGLLLLCGARDWTRTSTVLQPPAPQAGVSTNFTTRALKSCGIIPDIFLRDSKDKRKKQRFRGYLSINPEMMSSTRIPSASAL